MYGDNDMYSPSRSPTIYSSPISSPTPSTSTGASDMNSVATETTDFSNDKVSMLLCKTLLNFTGCFSLGFLVKKPLIVITLGRIKSENINRMITITGDFYLVIIHTCAFDI